MNSREQTIEKDPEYKNLGPITSLSERAFDTFDESLSAAKDQGEKILESKKGSAINHLTNYAYAIQEAAQSLQKSNHSDVSPYLQKTSDKITYVAQLLQEKPVKELADDIIDFARKNPALFIAGSVFAGAFIARFSKSSAQTRLKAAEAHHKGEYNQPQAKPLAHTSNKSVSSS
jgi:hypothetical protein